MIAPPSSSDVFARPSRKWSFCFAVRIVSSPSWRTDWPAPTIFPVKSVVFAERTTYRLRTSAPIVRHLLDAGEQFGVELQEHLDAVLVGRDRFPLLALDLAAGAPGGVRYERVPVPAALRVPP